MSITSNGSNKPVRSSVSDERLDWDRWLAEARTKRERREQELAEIERHYQSDMASD